jgi:hypothetical protein
MKKTGIAVVVAIAVALSCLFLLLSSSMPVPALAQEQADGQKPDLIITAIKPYHYEWLDEYEEDTPPPLWFNLTNYVDVTVENKGDDVESGEFYVCLYAKAEDDDEYKSIDKLPVPSLSTGASETVAFENWKPVGNDCFDDCSFTGTSKDYELKAVVECKNESDEENNEKTEEVTVCYNGYMADEPLKNIAHGTLLGGLIFTTGDGEYRGLYSVDSSMDTTYKITLPAGASVELARLNVYYTWHKDKESCPEMEVSIDGTVVPLDESYNDIKCMCSRAHYIYPWGNYVYNLTDYITGSGTYTVNVKRSGDTMFCIAAPGIILVYKDKDAPMIEYWINEGADVLIGGRRKDGGFLSLEECKNTATFPEPEEHVDLEVEEAALGVVSLWGDDEPDDVLYFNGEELKRGVYCGYSASCSEKMGSISMSIGGSGAQVGIAAIDVTRYLEDEDNEVIQGDDGDNMMPANAFLVISYKREENDKDEGEGDEVAPNPPNITAWNPIDAVVNNTEGESRTFNTTVNQTVDISWQINGIELQTNKSVTKAAYTNTSAVVGTGNVSAIATNTATELTDIHTWIWNVTLMPATTPTPAVNITTTSTSTPTATPISTSTPTLAITPTSTPTPAEEKKQPGEEETPVPGFELAMSSFILIAVAYLLRKRRKL